MKQHKRLLGLFSLFSLLFLFCVQLPAPVSAEVQKESEGSDSSYTESLLKRLSEGVHEITLKNGLRVLLYQRKQAPIFSGQIWVKVGSVNEVPGVTGVAHMLEHMAFKGSKSIGTTDFDQEKPLLEEADALHFKATDTELSDEETARLAELKESLEKIWKNNEFSRVYQRRGAVGLNAATAKDYTFYMVSLPSVDFDLWAWMESDRLLNPVFRQFYKERDVVREERRSRVEDNPTGQVYESLLSTAYKAHPNRLPTIGWDSDLSKLRKEDVEEFYERYYRPDNMVVVLVGDLDPQHVAKVAEQYFGRIKAVDTPLPKVRTVEPPQEGAREAIVRFEAKPQVMIGYHKPVYPNPHDLQFSILHSVLSEGRTSILYRELVQKRKLASSVYTTEAPGEQFPSLFVVAASPSKGVTNAQLVDAVQEILDKLKSEAIDEDKIAVAKKRLKVDLLNLLSSNHGLAKVLARTELFWGDWKSLFAMYDISFATTAEELSELAKAYFSVENRVVVRLESRAASVKSK